MKIISKNFWIFTGVFTAIYMGPCRKSYTLLARKFRTSEILDKWSLISKLSDIKLSHIPDVRYIFFHLFENPPVCHTYLTFSWYFKIFSRVCYDWVLSIGYHVNFADLGVPLGLSTFCIVLPTFFQNS